MFHIHACISFFIDTVIAPVILDGIFIIKQNK